MISIENLTKKYGNLTVYDNFNLDIEEYKVTCILGESGSGKTTLLNCIAGLTPYEGNIPVLKCSYIFQSPRLVPNLTVSGNLKLVCGDEERINEMLKRVKLSDKSTSYPFKLSGGQAQRVSIARAFLYGGDVLLMDEPFSSLDLKLKYEIFALFKELVTEYKKTALFVTHDVDEAAILADKIVVISGGKIVADIEADEGSKEEVRAKLISVLTEN